MSRSRKYNYKFEFSKGKGRHPFWWRVVAPNGNILCSSEGYLQKHGATKTVKNFIAAIKEGNFIVEEEFIVEDSNKLKNK